MKQRWLDMFVLAAEWCTKFVIRFSPGVNVIKQYRGKLPW